MLIGRRQSSTQGNLAAERAREREREREKDRQRQRCERERESERERERASCGGGRLDSPRIRNMPINVDHGSTFGMDFGHLMVSMLWSVPTS